jgi:tetratricopeptide (TPR) repeat protein
VTWGKYERAIQLFEEAARLGVNPSAADRSQRGRIHGRIGEMHFRLVRFDDAVKALTASLELNPNDTSARLLLGAIYLRRNRFEEAAAEYRRVIAIDSRNAAAHDGLAQVALSLGHYRESALEADAALAIDPSLQTSRYNKAMALIRSGREEGKITLEEYQQYEAKLNSIALNRTRVADFDRTALNLLSQGRPQKAIEALREGIRMHPDSGVLYLKLGLIQSQLRLHKDAAETFETMVRLKVDDFLVHRQLAREYDSLGRRQESQLQRVIYLQRYDVALQSNLN